MRKKKFSNNFVNFGLFLIYFLMFLISGVVQFVRRTFGEFDLMSVFSMLRLTEEVGNAGITGKLIWDMFVYCVLDQMTIIFLFWFASERFKNRRRCLKNLLFLSIFSIGFGRMIYVLCEVFSTNHGYFADQGTFYEDNYANPKNIKIQFPIKKNLVFISLESFEDSYKMKNLFGENLIPNMASREAKFFSVSNYTSCAGLANTLSGRIGALCGIPLVGHFDGPQILPNAKCIPEILRDNGYETLFMNGISNKFGGAEKFLNSRFDVVLGIEYFEKKIGKKKVRESSFSWLGIEDEKFFEYAKEEILNIKNKTQNYMVMMRTANTHFPEGWLSSSCVKQNRHIHRFRDVVKCNDVVIERFIDWIEHIDHDVVVVGLTDHKAMPTDLGPILYGLGRYRPLVNFITINTTASRNRSATAIDFMPTIIEAIGGRIDGRRLGLGTSLLWTKPSLFERLGIKNLADSMLFPSKLYESFEKKMPGEKPNRNNVRRRIGKVRKLKRMK